MSKIGVARLDLHAVVGDRFNLSLSVEATLASVDFSASTLRRRERARMADRVDVFHRQIQGEGASGPGMLRRWISPPSRLASSRLIARPRPVPPYRRLVLASAC